MGGFFFIKWDSPVASAFFFLSALLFLFIVISFPAWGKKHKLVIAVVVPSFLFPHFIPLNPRKVRIGLLHHVNLLTFFFSHLVEFPK